MKPLSSLSKWSVEAPSNVALIKYMGKRDQENHPINSSLSYTLNRFKSLVEIEKKSQAPDIWEPMEGSPILSECGREKFLNHWKRLKGRLGIEGSFKIRSSNNFPSDCGMASSASSFAALTLCAHKVNPGDVCQETLAQWSAKGSGSSCRSFFSSWVKWDEKGGVCSVDLPYKNLLYNVVVVSTLRKEVSSSQAHLNVKTSFLSEGRSSRAKRRLEDLVDAFLSRDWERAFEISWAEFWDMHALFETSCPSFGYMSLESLDVLNTVRKFWKENKDGPLVTMDAGPNVYLLYRQDQEKAQTQLKKQLDNYQLL